MSLEDKLKENFEGKNSNESTVETPVVSMPSQGWAIIPMENIPSKGDYYPEGTVIRVKSPTTAEIKNYSRMDENVPSTVEFHIDEIMNKNLEFIFPDGRKGSYNDLTQFDKIHFLFVIRERAMQNYNSRKKLFQNVKNPKNPTEDKKVEITHEVFDYYQIPKGIAKWYEPAMKCFKIFDESNKPSIDLKIYIPTVGTTNWIKNRIRELEIQKQSGEEVYYDEYFFKCLQYLVDDHRKLKGEAGLDYVESLRKWYNELELEVHEVLVEIVDKISFGIKPNISVKFGEEEVIVPIRFREYKSIFSISDRSSILLSDTE